MGTDYKCFFESIISSLDPQIQEAIAFPVREFNQELLIVCSDYSENLLYRNSYPKNIRFEVVDYKDDTNLHDPIIENGEPLQTKKIVLEHIDIVNKLVFYKQSKDSKVWNNLMHKGTNHIIFTVNDITECIKNNYCTIFLYEKYNPKESIFVLKIFYRN